MKKTTLIVAFLFSVALSISAQIPQLSLVQVATGFTKPTDLKNCGDNRIFVLQQGGRIRIMDKSGNINATDFLNITSRVLSTGNEQGLLGLAFSPNYKQDGYFYVNYTTGSSAGSTRISRFQVSVADSNVADPNSEVILLTFTQPYTNHNGGNMMFGKDGYLYISQGDGGSAGDPQGNGQNTNTYLAKMLRIDVSGGGSTYSIPPTNPFYGQTGKKQEIWAYGLRNPWRSSIDRVTGDMWIGDVGQGVYEEIDFEDFGASGGKNYGWSCREGLHAYNGCANSPNFTSPVFEYSHSEFSSCSVTGGYVYRGTNHNSLFGRYLFTDYCSGKFWSLKRLANGTFDPDTLQTFLTYQYSAFGEDNYGELYVVGSANGRVYRIRETSNCNPVAFITFEDTVSACNSYQLKALRGDSISFQWYNSLGAIGGANNYSLDVTNSGWYKVKTTKSAGCETMSDSVYVKINTSTPLTQLKTTTTLCRNSDVVALSNFVTPSGGTFTLNGSAATSFNPTTANIGANAIVCQYVNSEGCSSQLAFNVTLYDTTAIQRTAVSSLVCNNNNQVQLSSYVSPTGGSFSGAGISNDVLDATSVPVGSTSVLYEYTDGNFCTSSLSFNLTVDNCTGIQQSGAGAEITILPNPSTGKFIVTTTTNDRDLLIKVMDVSGKLCHQQHTNGNQSVDVDVSQLPAGNYVLHVVSSKNITTKNIIIQK